MEIMKRKILLFLAVLSTATTAATAKEDKPVRNVNAKASSVLEAYVEAHISNDAVLYNQILNDGAVLKVNRQDRVVQHTKKELINFYKKAGKLVLNCKANLEILSECDCIVLARVDFEFPEFVQHNYVQIEKGKNGHWKIMQINRFTS